MSLIKRWNKFAKRKIYINEKFEISCGRLVFCLIVMLLAIFEIDIWWIMPVFSLKKREKNNEPADKGT